ncbi:GTPase regulator associated with FAK isoform X2 [Arctopsyche grandis]|uniref:GTPase regulator associated with FAK isoform X2 n=1 Tax=Arctopsyche grandis TaxID=121162 RepID=UPI00406D8FCD
MGVMLMPLEFTDCLTDSPWFRENLHKHEKELDRTSQQIKRLIKEVKDLVLAARRLSTAQRSLSDSLEQFDFECIGQSLTEDELVISKSLKQFAQLIRIVEDERERMLDRANDQIIQPLEKFRKDHIGAVKEGKKKFDKKTAKFCQSQERYLNLSTKKQDIVLQEADASLDMAKRDFCQASLEYVFLLQEVQERKKFEFVETLLGFMFGWLTFYHQGHEVHKDCKPYMSELQLRIQKTRGNFEETSKKTECLMKKMMEMRQMKQEDSSRPPFSADYTIAGYLFLMEKKAFGTTWTKQYCMYEKSSKEFKITPFNQITSKVASPPDLLTLSSCIRRMSDSIDKRFCFDITAEGRPGISFTLQALGEDDRKAWLDAMDGKEPTYARQNLMPKSDEWPLDEVGLIFVNCCIDAIEGRGLEEQGLYRVAGVSSKVTKLLAMGLDKRKTSQERLGVILEDHCEWETKTLTSALKTYLRHLPEPLMTYKYHNSFIIAAKQDSRHLRVNDIHTLIYQIPKQNFNLLEIVIKHLKKVSVKADKNLMTVSNLSVCLGPTLLRPEEETVASIMDLKFYNVVVEILIDNYEKLFHSQPEITLDVSNGTQMTHGEMGLPSTGNTAGPQSPSHIRSPRYSTSQPVTHAVTKTYYDGPLAVPANMGARPQPPAYQPPPAARPYSPPQRQALQHHSASGLSHPSLDQHRDTLLNSTSSSNESVSSISSRDVSSLSGAHSSLLVHPSNHSQLIHNQFSLPQHANLSSSQGQLNMNSQNQLIVSSNHGSPINHHGSPVKTRRIVNHALGAHYAANFRPQSHPNIRVRTLYACVGENDEELSFEPNQIITNVISSAEPGWLRGTLNGKTGLIPENYVAALP